MVFMNIGLKVKSAGIRMDLRIAVGIGSFIEASQLNNLLMGKRYKSEQVVKVTLICMSASVLFCHLQLPAASWALLGTIVMIFAILCCIGIYDPNTSALSLAPFERNAGTAAALLAGAFQMTIGTVASVIVSFSKGNYNQQYRWPLLWR